MALTPEQIQMMQLFATGAGAAGGPIGMGIGAGVQLGLGLYQTIQAQQGLNELKKTPRPTFDTSIASDEYNKALKMAERGFTPQEMSDAVTRYHQSQRYALQKGKDLAGGSMSGALNAVSNAMKSSYFSDLASRDAALKRQNIAAARQAGYTLMGQENRQIASDLDYRNRMEVAYGQAKTKGIENMINPLTRFAHYFDFNLLKGLPEEDNTGKQSQPGDNPYYQISEFNNSYKNMQRQPPEPFVQSGSVSNPGAAYYWNMPDDGMRPPQPAPYKQPPNYGAAYYWNMPETPEYYR